MKTHRFYTHFARTALLLFLCTSSLFAQDKVKRIADIVAEYRNVKTNFKSVTPFEASNRKLEEFNTVKEGKGLKKGKVLKLKKQIRRQLLDEPPTTMALVIPNEEGTNDTLDLFRVEITTPEFEVNTLGNEKKAKVEKSPSIHYQGVNRNDGNSLVAISINENELAGLVSSSKGNKVLGKFKDSDEDFIYYDDKNLNLPFPLDPNKEDAIIPHTRNGGRLSTTATNDYACKVIKIYFECDYQLYLDFGSSTASVTNYVTTLFNQVALLYKNEGINLQISTINIWTTTDPYASQTTTGGILSAFQANVGATYTGDLAHFLTTRSLGGGIAWLNGNICTNKSYTQAVSANLTTTVVSYPTYSWNVMVVSHEMGHNLGSNHTQWCGWPGGAIDNCYTTEGGCAPGAAPTNGGTVMSYCHTTSYGINLANGFGPLPGNVIRTNVSNASCLSLLPTPSGLTTSNITTTGATFSWAGPSQTYTIEIAPQGSSTWQAIGSVFGFSFNASGFSGCTTYQWRVTSDCGTSSSTNFTTTCCPAPTASLSGSQTITSGQSANLSVALTGTAPWSLTLSNGQTASGITTSPYSIAVSPTSTTTYTITNVSNSCGNAVGTGSATVTVNTGGGNCPTSLTLSTPITSGTQNFQASQTIFSTSQISAGANVTYKAGTSVKLQTGFKATSGAYFRAYLGGCTPGARLAAEETLEDILMAFPNPANNQITIKYRLTESGTAGIYLADMTGQEIKTLVAERYHEAGTYQEQISLESVQTGIYLYILRGDHVLKARRLVIQH